MIFSYAFDACLALTASASLLAVSGMAYWDSSARASSFNTSLRTGTSISELGADADCGAGPAVALTDCLLSGSAAAAQSWEMAQVSKAAHRQIFVTTGTPFSRECYPFRHPEAIRTGSSDVFPPRELCQLLPE